METGKSDGRIISLNVGKARDVPAANDRTVRTGIFKSAVVGPIALGLNGLSGDEQADLKVHGGPYKAVYSYASEHYSRWKQELGVDELAWGAFGENLTTAGLMEEDLVVGERFRVGSAILQVAQPRMPCFKLALRFGRSDMVKLFWASGRSGTYFSVVQEGEISAGDEMVKVQQELDGVTIADVVRLYSGATWESELRERALRSPLRGSWKQGIRERLTESS